MYQNFPYVPTSHLLWLHIHHTLAGFLLRQHARSGNLLLSAELCLTFYLVGHNILRDVVVSPLFKATSLLRKSKRDLYGENRINWTRLYIKSITFQIISQAFVTQRLRLCAKQRTECLTCFCFNAWTPFLTPLILDTTSKAWPQHC